MHSFFLHELMSLLVNQKTRITKALCCYLLMPETSPFNVILEIVNC